MYSPAWRKVKYAPRETVKINAKIASFRFPSIKAWWAQVTVTPEAKRTAVLRRGTAQGFKGVIPVGGQVHPISGVGANLL